jgi:5-formyltetrahydrofolate cyclo-ligase
MRTNIQESKLMLRRRIRILLDKMTTVQRAAASVQACALLGQQAVWQRARSIAFYAPLPEELDVWALVLESLAAAL